MTTEFVAPWQNSQWREFLTVAARLKKLAHAPQVFSARNRAGQDHWGDVSGELHHRSLGSAVGIDLVAQVFADAPVEVDQFGVHCPQGALTSRLDQVHHLGEGGFDRRTGGCRQGLASGGKFLFHRKLSPLISLNGLQASNAMVSFTMQQASLGRQRPPHHRFAHHFETRGVDHNCPKFGSSA
jgi:hypothetical protein